MNEFEALLNDYLPEEKKKGEIATGIILRKEREFSYLDMNDKLEGKILTREIEDMNIGDTVEVKVLKNDGENIHVSKFLLDKEKEFASYETGDIISGEITEKVKGGYKVRLGKNNAFLPFSLSNLRKEDEFKNKKFKFLILDKNERNITLSRNDLVKKEEDDYYKELNLGDILEGKIKEILDFGLIVDLNRTTGFIHISEIDWHPVKDLKNLFQDGELIKAKIIELDKENKKIKMSIKQTKEDPWKNFLDKHHVDEELEVEIKEIMPFGLVVEHEKNRGFIHISEISWNNVDELSKYYSVGQKINAKIIELDEKGRNYKLSVKQLEENPWKKLSEGFKTGDIVEGKIEKILDFAILPNIENILGFIHISELTWTNNSNKIEGFKLGDTIKAKIIELNEDAKIFKLSIKQLEFDPWLEIKEKFKKGDIIEREIKEIFDFALLVDVFNGVEGMVHVSEISYRRINKLKEKFSIGEKIKVKILDFNEEKRRVSLSIKAILDDIWAEINKIYSVDDILKGEVINTQDYGIFLKLEDGLEVFIHNNDFSWEKNHNLSYKPGDIIEFKILKIDEAEKKISGGIKQLVQSPWKEAEEEHKIGNIVKIKIENVTNNGLIVKLTDRFNGFVPNRELDEKAEYKEGDEIEAVVIETNEKKRSIILSVNKLAQQREEQELKELLKVYGVDNSEQA